MKIENIISTCNDCRECIRYKRADANFGSVLVCAKIERIVRNYDTISHSSGINADVEIPDSCPLEDYKGDQKEI